MADAAAGDRLRFFPRYSSSPHCFRFYAIQLLLVWVCLLSQSCDALVIASPSIHVFDNVLDTETQSLLHSLASASGLGHKVFSRPTNSLERALHQIVREQLADQSEYIEYWCRQEWRHIEAHADVDEHLAKRQDRAGDTEQFRYPTHGHVLYLQVGEKVRGPTCLFGCTSGGDLATASSSLELTTVPAVPGRLLRFDGRLLHAVPRPTDIWLRSFVQGTPDFTPEWERSVILFNTWQETPPLDVPMSSTNMEETCEGEEDLVIPRATWNEVEVTDLSSGQQDPTQNVKVWLLGNERRRNHLMRTVKLTAPPDPIRDGLHEPTRPSRILLSR